MAAKTSTIESNHAPKLNRRSNGSQTAAEKMAEISTIESNHAPKLNRRSNGSHIAAAKMAAISRSESGHKLKLSKKVYGFPFAARRSPTGVQHSTSPDTFKGGTTFKRRRSTSDESRVGERKGTTAERYETEMTPEQGQHYASSDAFKGGTTFQRRERTSRGTRSGKRPRTELRYEAGAETRETGKTGHPKEKQKKEV